MYMTVTTLLERINMHFNADRKNLRTIQDTFSSNRLMCPFFLREILVGVCVPLTEMRICPCL